MAPKRGESIERNDDYKSFMRRLTEYHEKRGTKLETEPKVGVRHIDLYKLYNRVVEEGGYDLCSDTKAKPLMWRKLAEEFVGKNVYTAAQAFQIKSVYYKNLCSYEIKTHWQQEPPPKEILEEATAKGGNVMGRTLENFQPSVKREQENLQDGEASDASPEQQTPKDEKQEEDPGSATGRSTRGLRQQPPQRVLFQPDLTSARQPRGQNSGSQGPHGSPAPVSAPLTNGTMYSTSQHSGASATLASYEPSQSYPLTLKPVVTPANNPKFYTESRKRKLEADATPLAKKYKNIMLPGTGFIGPNIYVRAQLALQSGLPDEEQYALHHLVKISHERGDKYRFDQFPGLADALLKKTLQVSGLFYNVDWDISYDDEPLAPDDEMLDGLHGTSDVLEKLKSRIPLITSDNLRDAQCLDQLNRITEAGLVMRNMCMLEENALYLSRQPLTRDYLAIVLDLPQHPYIVELQYYALETAEQVLKYCDLGVHDALYHSLLLQLEREDRGVISLALRTIARIAMKLEPPKRLDAISDSLLQKVQAWLLVDDEELRSSSLDFLMQYTSFADNVDNLLQAVDSSALARQLSKLTFFAAKAHHNLPPSTSEEQDDTATTVPRLSRSMVERLLKIDEPERSSEWLRMCFHPDPNSEMTQISLWQAYQSTFSAFNSTHPNLIAGEFIKNVSNTFTGATAQVAGQKKYVIKGIRPRKVPIETGLLSGAKASDKGKGLQVCRWTINASVEASRDPATGVVIPASTKEAECSEWFRGGGDMLKHVLGVHLQVPTKRPTSGDPEVDKMDIDSSSASAKIDQTLKNELINGAAAHSNATDEKFDFASVERDEYRCKWSDCSHDVKKSDSGKLPSIVQLARHVQTHLPDPSSSRPKSNLKPDARPKSTASEFLSLMTLQDDDKKPDAAGITLSAALVLRNIAKFMPTDQRSMTPALHGDTGGKDSFGTDKPVAKVFDDNVMDTLFFAQAHNKTLRDYLGSVLRAVRIAAE